MPATAGGSGGRALGHLDQGSSAALRGGPHNPVPLVSEVQLTFDAGQLVDHDFAADRVEHSVQHDVTVDGR